MKTEKGDGSGMRKSRRKEFSFSQKESSLQIEEMKEQPSRAIGLAYNLPKVSQAPQHRISNSIGASERDNSESSSINYKPQ